MAEPAENLEEPSEEQQEEQTTSLDDTLAETLRNIEAREQEPPEQEAEQEVKSEEEAPAEEPKDEEQKDEEPQVEQEVQPQRPPSSWSAAAKAEFAKLPPIVQQEALKREEDFHKGIGEYREKADMADRLRQVLNPYEAYLRSRGTTTEQTVQNMLHTAYTLDTATPEQRMQHFTALAQRFGIDLSQLAGQQAEHQVDPQIQTLQQRLDQLQNTFVAQTQAAQQQELGQAQSSIESFRSELDDSGNFAHLYFDDVRSDMANAIEVAAQQGKQLTLQDAYDQAIWARPDIRQLLLAQQQEQRKIEQNQKTTQAKKRASASVSTTGSYAAAEQPPKGSVEETMWATLRNIEARDE